MVLEAAKIEALSLFLTRDTSGTRSLFSSKILPVAPLEPSSSSSDSVAAAATAAVTAGGTVSPATTITAIAMSREKALEEKGYADSRARQANLRKNYQQVVTDRSPTVSLTAMKKNKQKDWLKYLGD